MTTRTTLGHAATQPAAVPGNGHLKDSLNEIPMALQALEHAIEDLHANLHLLHNRLAPVIIDNDVAECLSDPAEDCRSELGRLVRSLQRSVNIATNRIKDIDANLGL